MITLKITTLNKIKKEEEKTNKQKKSIKESTKKRKKCNTKKTQFTRY